MGGKGETILACHTGNGGKTHVLMFGDKKNMNCFENFKFRTFKECSRILQ
jgi:hypothetical protein